jgi:hypothetical protein
VSRSKEGASGANIAASLFLSDSVLSKLSFLFIESCCAKLGMLLVVVLASAEEPWRFASDFEVVALVTL